MRWLPAGILAPALLVAAPSYSIDLSRPEVTEFVGQMAARHGFEVEELRQLLAGVERQQAVLDAIARPPEKVKPWFEYRELFLTEKRVALGAEFWLENEAAIANASAATGVPAEILVAILGVETYYGRITGRYRVIDALGTLAFDYPPRSAFFRSELEQFLLLTREEGIDPFLPTGSYAGAMGAPQFMPSSFRAYAVDSSQDGARDLWTDWVDVLGSIGNYLVKHGWRPGAPVVAPARIVRAEAPTTDNRLRLSDTVAGLRGKGVEFDTRQSDDAEALLIVLDGADGQQYWVGFRNFYVITRYNRSKMYAMAVHQLAEEICARVAASQT